MHAYPSRELTESLSESALIMRLRSTEHDFIERKPLGQTGDWLQTIIAFANSAPIGWPAILFVGVNDDGRPQEVPEQLERLVRSVSSTVAKAYPTIYCHVVLLTMTEGCCVAVVVPGSPDRPHFAGRPYVRVGDSTREVTRSEYELLLAGRTSLGSRLAEFLGKEISVLRGTKRSITDLMVTRTITTAKLVELNPHYLTIETENDKRTSIPLRFVALGFDHHRGQLMLVLEVEPASPVRPFVP